MSMLRAESLFVYRLAALMEWLSFGVLALYAVTNIAAEVDIRQNDI